MQRLVAVALQCEKGAVGADLRNVFDGVALVGAHRRTMFDIDRPDMESVGVILIGRIDQALAVLAQDNPCHLEPSRRECAGRPALNGDGVKV